MSRYGHLRACNKRVYGTGMSIGMVTSGLATTERMELGSVSVWSTQGLQQQSWGDVSVWSLQGLQQQSVWNWGQSRYGHFRACSNRVYGTGVSPVWSPRGLQQQSVWNWGQSRYGHLGVCNNRVYGTGVSLGMVTSGIATTECMELGSVSVWSLQGLQQQSWGDVSVWSPQGLQQQSVWNWDESRCTGEVVAQWLERRSSDPKTLGSLPWRGRVRNSFVCVHPSHNNNNNKEL